MVNTSSEFTITLIKPHRLARILAETDDVNNANLLLCRQCHNEGQNLQTNSTANNAILLGPVVSAVTVQAQMSPLLASTKLFVRPYHHEPSFGGEHVVCIDYDSLNTEVETKSTSLPSIEDLIISTPPYPFFTVGSCSNLFLSSGFEVSSQVSLTVVTRMDSLSLISGQTYYKRTGAGPFAILARLSSSRGRQHTKANICISPRLCHGASTWFQRELRHY